MALIYCDSFDGYNSYSYRNWTGGSPTLSTGRFGSGQGHNEGNGAGTRRALATNYGTLIMGFAWQCPTDFTTAGTSRRCIQFWDGSSEQFGFAPDTSGKWRAMRGATVLATGSTVMSTGVWYYIEVKVTFSTTVGTYELRINGTTEFSGTGANTSATGNAYANGIGFSTFATSGGTGHCSIIVDDLYLCDTSGATNNNFLGDVRVEALFPNGNGTTSNLVGSDGNSTDNYQNVDDGSTINTADYNESGTSGNKDTYAYGDLTSTSGTVYGLMVTSTASKTDAGSMSIKAVARASSTETDGSANALSTTVTSYFEVYETKPGGGSWSVSDVNSAEFGMKVV